MTEALPEIHAAHLAGYGSWRAFQAARRKGAFPKPDIQLPDGPRWSRARLEAWLRGEEDAPKSEEQELIRRARG